MNFDELFESKMDDLNKEKPLEESIGLAVAGLGAITMIGALVYRIYTNAQVRAFFDREYPQLDRDVRKVERHIKMVTSLKELKEVEREGKKITDRLESLIEHTDELDNRQRQRILRSINMTIDHFENQIEERTDEIAEYAIARSASEYENQQRRRIQQDSVRLSVE